MLTIEPRMVIVFWARSPISFIRVSFWCQSLDSHPTFWHEHKDSDVEILLCINWLTGCNEGCHGCNTRKYHPLFQDKQFGSGNLDVYQAKLGSLSAFLLSKHTIFGIRQTVSTHLCVALTAWGPRRNLRICSILPTGTWVNLFQDTDVYFYFFPSSSNTCKVKMRPNIIITQFTVWIPSMCSSERKQFLLVYWMCFSYLFTCDSFSIHLISCLHVLLQKLQKFSLNQASDPCKFTLDQTRSQKHIALFVHHNSNCRMSEFLYFDTAVVNIKTVWNVNKSTWGNPIAHINVDLRTDNKKT